MNATKLPVAVVIGATSKWQADGRNTRLAHGRAVLRRLNRIEYQNTKKLADELARHLVRMNEGWSKADEKVDECKRQIKVPDASASVRMNSRNLSKLAPPL